jgi:hypothetical protein
MIGLPSLSTTQFSHWLCYRAYDGIRVNSTKCCFSDPAHIQGFRLSMVFCLLVRSKDIQQWIELLHSIVFHWGDSHIH